MRSRTSAWSTTNRSKFDLVLSKVKRDCRKVDEIDRVRWEDVEVIEDSRSTCQ